MGESRGRPEDPLKETWLTPGLRQYLKDDAVTWPTVCALLQPQLSAIRTLWEGRYKSCLVQNERYLLECYRYIELNPVRAGMMDDPADYRWSSYCDNGLGQSGFRLTPHDEYLRLGRSGAERRETYRSLFTGHVDGSMIKDIRDAVNKGLALGSNRFKDEIKANLKRRVRPAKMGRPRSQTNNTQKQKSLL